MRALRRILQVFTFVGTLLVGVLALALIVSQTPWFRDWLRRYIVRESKQYLNGQLTIGGLGGNLLFGIDLSDVAVDMSGERVVAAKALQVDYSVFQLISKGVYVDQIKIDQPMVQLEREANGAWNLTRIMKPQEREADRRGPMRPISLKSIEVADASVEVRDQVAEGVKVPRRFNDVDLKGTFEYAPVHYSVDVNHLSFRGTSPELTMQQLTGKLAIRDDNLYVDNVALTTEQTSLTVSGVIERYLSTPIVKLTTSGHVSLPEVGRVVPAAAGYNLHPALNIQADGPADRLGLTVDVKSEAGNLRGTLTTDVQAPDFAAKGDLDVERLNLAPLLKDSAQRSNLTGHAKLDVVMKSAPASAPVIDRLRGTFAFAGPHVIAAGYEARNVKVTGRIAGPRITIDGRAAAYGGTATARGFIVVPAPGRALAFDLRGSGGNVDLRALPPSMGVPRLATNLSVADYHVAGEGQSIHGTAALNRSTIEGATISSGSSAEFALTPSSISYTAHATVADLDLDRLGAALRNPTLAKPDYDSRIHGTVDVTGSIPRRAAGTADNASNIAAMKIDATGRLTDSDVFGGRLPDLAFDAHLDHGSFNGRANGSFEGFNPARISGRENLAGSVSGTVNANVAVADINAPITPDALTAEGEATLTESTIGGLRVDSATIQGKYASQVGDITKFDVTGPDVKATAAGRLALDRKAQSDLKYHVEAIDLSQLAQLAGQSEVKGAATLDGTLTGNGAALQTTGTLNGSNVAYASNSALDLNGRYTVVVPEMDFAKARAESTTDATFVEIGGWKLNSVKATTTYEQQKIDFTTSIKEQKRELDATGQVILHPDHQEIHLPSLAVRTAGVEWRTAPGSSATVKYGAGKIEFDNVKLLSADQSLDASGTLTTGAGAPSGSIDVHARNVDLQQLETLALQNRGFTGRLNADANISGTTAAPIVTGKIAVADGAFQTYHYQSLTANVDYKAQRVGLDATLQQTATEFITARGSVPTSLFAASPTGEHVEPAPGEGLDLQVKSTALSLGIVQGFTDVVTDVTGTFEGDVRLTGSGQDPHAQGFVDIKNGGFSVPATGGTFRGLTTRVEFQPDAVKIQEFKLLDHHGEELRVAGELAVHQRQLGAVNITIESDNFEVLDNELGDVQLEVALKIGGELRRPKLEGTINVDAGRLEADRILALTYNPYSVESMPDVVSAERAAEDAGSAEDATKAALSRASVSAAEPGAAEKAASDDAAAAAAPRGPIAEAIAVDVQVTMPDNLVVRGKGLRPGGPTGTKLGDMNVTIGGDVRVRKDPGAPPTLVGVVRTIRGFYEFQGRRFDLERDGTVRFVGLPTINPLLDVAATRKIPNTGVTARIHVTGSARVPVLALTSDPPLEESDILALVVFNRPVNELGSGERSSLAATAGGIASGFIAAPLGESIGKALDLDLFEIATTTDSGALGAVITVGQQLNEKTFIKMRQQFGDRSTTEFQLEYQIARFLRAQASGAPEASGAADRINERRVERAGIDLIFFFSY